MSEESELTSEEQEKRGRLTSIHAHFLSHIRTYEKEKSFQKWHTDRGVKVYERYKDERNTASDSGASKMNILWSNTETLRPAAFSRAPKPDVARRYNARDPIGRVASMMLERCLSYHHEYFSDFKDGLDNALKDRLLPGRGITWQRYEAEFGQRPITLTEDEMSGAYINDDGTRFNLFNEDGDSVDYDDTEMDEEGNYYQEYTSHERVCTDYVNWQHFGHSIANTWEEVECAWRIVYMDKEEFVGRFEGVAEDNGWNLSSVTFSDKDDPAANKTTVNTEPTINGKVAVYEIWDKSKKRVVWVTKSQVDVPLDMIDDPLSLQGFWPFPMPLLSTTSTDSLCPVPDYCMYQDQAKELDRITARIDSLVEALKVIGVYDAEQTDLKKMLNHGLNNDLIPVTTWNAFSEKGGIKGCVDFMPLDQVVGALQQAYRARDEVKQVIYEITGLSDIIRGSTAASETATAQQIKSNFASLRIRPLQQDMERFAAENICIQSELICNFFSDETILKMSLIDTMTEQDQQMVPQALALLRDGVRRGFTIGVETDSMVEMDQEKEKQSRNEFLVNSGKFIKEAAMAATQFPHLGPLFGEMLMFGVRGHKAGREMESVFEEAMENMKNQPQQKQEEQQDPNPADMAKQQMELQKIKMQAELDAQNHQLRMRELEAKIQGIVIKEKAQAEGDIIKAQIQSQAQVV